jgi:hypothetical protein
VGPERHHHGRDRIYGGGARRGGGTQCMPGNRLRLERRKSPVAFAKMTALERHLRKRSSFTREVSLASVILIWPPGQVGFSTAL